MFAQGLRYAIVGGVVAAIYIVTTTVLAEFVGLPFQLALAIGFGAAIAAHFTLHRLFVWVHDGAFALALHEQAGRYLIIVSVQYAVTAASTGLLPAALGIPVAVVYGATVVLVTAVSFLILRNRIFHSGG